MTIILLALFGLSQVDLLAPIPEMNRRQITIVDGGKARPYERTTFDAGPVPGDHLNGHYFPAVNAYNTGRYSVAIEDFTYVIRRPSYLDANPRKSEFLSVVHYLRGMIYLYHAKGVGRHAMAKADFEAAIDWNPSMYVAYLELSRVYSDLGFTKEATDVIQHMLELKPTKDAVDEAQRELQKLTTSGSK